MAIGYRLAYFFGLTPWEKAGLGFEPQLARLLHGTQAGAGGMGLALDLGCGTGDRAIQLARQGWTVTGIDVVAQAIATAKKKAARAGVDVRFLSGDVTDLGDGVGTGYRLVLDVGCFHGLNPQQRLSCAREITRVVGPGARLLMFAFGPGHRGPLPRGVSRDEVERTFAGWTMTDDQPADTTGMPGPLKNSNPRWFTLERHM